MSEKELISIIPQKVVSEWAKYAIEAFQKSLQKKKIGITGALFNSFKSQLQNNGGDVGAVMLKFAMYGRFRDMGVGRGMKAYERKANKVNLIGAKRYGANVSYSRRQAKRWYPKVKTHETLRLQEILIRDLGFNIREWIASEWQGNIEVRS